MASGLKHSLKAGAVEMPEGIIFTAGTAVPTDGDSGYKIGSMYIDVAGSASSTLYINEGTATSCDFNAVMTL